VRRAGIGRNRGGVTARDVPNREGVDVRAGSRPAAVMPLPRHDVRERHPPKGKVSARFELFLRRVQSRLQALARALADLAADDAATKRSGRPSAALTFTNQKPVRGSDPAPAAQLQRVQK